FFFNDTATTEIYTLTLHDALPISLPGGGRVATVFPVTDALRNPDFGFVQMRSEEHTSELRHLGISYAVFCLKKKSTRLNSSHLGISYAVFCLKKKNKEIQ